MALRDQPYLPLYIQDFMTDEKLNECSAKACGVYIKIMCLMHKSEEYGKILLKQKDKQTGNQIKNFAIKCDRHLPYGVAEIEESIAELISEGVLYIEGDYLCQKRMIKDNIISELRSKAGTKGAIKKADFATAKPQANAKAKGQANSEYENEYENENEIVFENTEKGGTGEKTIIGEVIEQWQQSGLTVEISEAKDIRELCEKILNIKDISQADEQKRHELLGVMQKIISWVKSENNIKYYGSLKSINNNFSKIINSLKNGTKQTKRTGEGSSPDELAEIVRRRFSDKQKV